MIKSFLNLVVLAFVLVPLRGQSSTLGRAEWQLHEPEPTASGAAYAVDPDRRRLVRFGGNRSGPGDVFLTDETWEFDGRIWRLMHPRVSPPPMAGVGMAYDPVRKTVLLFGGQDKLTTKSVSYHNQTWEWDGQEWRQLKPKNSPSPRWGCEQGLVTDFKLNRIVLYGGYVPGGLFPLPLKETWVWNGTDWKYLNLSVQPQERYGPAVGFCAASGKVILHGGQARSNLQALGDTWELDGEVWKQLSFDLKDPDASPAFRGGLATSDPASNDMLFLGTVQEVWQGSSQTWVDIDDLWAFDGKAWKQRQKSTGLLAKSYRPGPFHELGGTLYLVSGLRWTLSYDGKGWTELVDWAGNAPDILIAFYLVHDVARHETFLIGSPDPWGYSKSPPIPDPLDVYLVRDNQIEKMQTKVQPPYGGAIVHHPGIGKTVYFDSGVYSNDRRAWLFDGTDWTKSIGSPTDPIPDSTVYHPGRNTIVTVEYYRTWEWDAQKGWALLAEHKDGPRGIGLVFDAGRKKLVGYGPKDSTAYGLR
ncbi:MAG: hypothetical protein R3F30_06220 [Planctomycetota bacterium]